ncbi:hypothetical protein K8Z61_04370 [Nocardioides sp. TRM66260-LWL]|uniref:hypothetical protein n=1 Tax=Nocardioides sp. TRM66260-LWL TaxID=2874478 RepID=UPI001CC44EA4|nr:hypothetical protein [Nocardioides sp. TRM66260-LWL]MBZ5733723.1 hypothetical protein [Nocardioides sp. TRM66260-LWL]
MISPKDRTAALALLKARGAKPRKGTPRLVVGDLHWYVGLRASGRGPDAGWLLEVGCWLPRLTPEPEAGAIDCPAMLDVAAGDDLLATLTGVVDGIADVGDLDALRGWLAAHPEAVVDRVLRDRLG